MVLSSAENGLNAPESKCMFAPELPKVNDDPVEFIDKFPEFVLSTPPDK